MSYSQLSPNPGLAPYIDAYWTVRGSNTGTKAERIMPDGCVDIIINLGEEFLTDDNSFMLKSHQTYLVGTMTRYKEITHPHDANLIGIRFKPAGFSFFFTYSSLYEITDKTVEFDKKLAPEINEQSKDLTDSLNHFFTQRLTISYPGQLLVDIIADATNLKGQISIEALAKRHFISPRQLERLFKLHIGTRPKEYINFIRYQSTLEKIRNNHTKKSLIDIALESGYYDHAHLSNEIRKYTGSTPSGL